MTPQQTDLWHKLQGFDLNVPGAKLKFSERLGRENSWSKVYTDRVLEEYRRFLFLAVSASHPVAPSDQVDLAWHLHLLYTDSYWNGLCRGVLGRPFHHGPTQGGAAEGAKFHDWYEHTLASYRKFFGEKPPPDIWPSPEERFAAVEYRRINLKQHWVIPKPVWLTSRWRTSLAILTFGSLILAALLAGCSSLGLSSWNVFDWMGPDFIEFFVFGTFFFFITAGIVRWQLSQYSLRGLAMPLEDPYQIALLAGGMYHATNLALISMVARKEIEIASDSQRTVSRLSQLTDTAHPFERVVFDTLGVQTNMPLVPLRKKVAANADILIEELENEGYYLTPALRRRALWIPLGIAFLVPLTGLIKIMVGLSRNRPVDFLIFGCIVTFILSLVFFARTPWRSSAGRQALHNLRLKYASLRKTGREYEDIDHMPMNPLAVALFGLQMLKYTELNQLNLTKLLSLPSDSSGLSSACGGGGGHGCGGGGGHGCGGCGGGH